VGNVKRSEDTVKFRFALAMCALITALCASGAGASQTLRGIVLTVLAGKHQAVVRHEAYGGMPSMSMVFGLSPADVSRVHQGDRIEATVSESSDPETLSNVRVVAKAATASQAEPLHSMTLLNTGDAMPAISLLDQRGKPFTFADFRGKITLLSFIYTRCRDARMCPLISAHFHQLQARLNAGQYHLVEVTLDPAFDRPDVLAKYAERFDADAARWSIGTGDPHAVLNFAASFGIVPFPDPAIGLIHTERTVLIDRDGRIADLIDEAGWDPDNVIARLQTINKAPANPIALLDYNLSKAAVAICGNGVAGSSGLLDLILVSIIFALGVWLLFRIGRFLYTTKT
jgi:protein SCO1/2